MSMWAVSLTCHQHTLWTILFLQNYPPNVFVSKSEYEVVHVSVSLYQISQPYLHGLCLLQNAIEEEYDLSVASKDQYIKIPLPPIYVSIHPGSPSENVSAKTTFFAYHVLEANDFQTNHVQKCKSSRHNVSVLFLCEMTPNPLLEPKSSSLALDVRC